jgi:hypothetical protein
VAVAKGNELLVSKLLAYARLPSRRYVASQARASAALLPATTPARRFQLRAAPGDPLLQHYRPPLARPHSLRQIALSPALGEHYIRSQAGGAGQPTRRDSRVSRLRVYPPAAQSQYRLPDSLAAVRDHL